MRNKTKLTADILEKLPEHLRIPLVRAMPLWWYNIREAGGMRLTQAGFELFTQQLQLQSHQISYDIKKNGHMRMLLELDRKLTCPYYIEKQKTIHLFGEKEAVLAMLYSDLEQFIANYS